MKIEQKLVEYVTKTLVDQPDAVRVERVVDDRGILLTLHVDDEDLGRVIGKGGATAQSLRLILKALGSKNGERYNLRIADGQPRPEAPETRDKDADDESAAETSDQPAGEDSPDDRAGEDSPDDQDDDDRADEDSQASDSDDSQADDDDQDDSADDPGGDQKSESAVEKAKSELASLDDLDI